VRLDKTGHPDDNTRVNGDSGYYALLIRLPKASHIAVGSWGEADFPAGWYVYVGTARKGLYARLNRHMRRAKMLRWHVDYLLQHGTLALTCTWDLDGRSECGIAEAIAGLPGACWRPRRFGASDCRCEGHLIHFKEEPEKGLLTTI